MIQGSMLKPSIRSFSGSVITFGERPTGDAYRHRKNVDFCGAQRKTGGPRWVVEAPMTIAYDLPSQTNRR